MATPFRCYYPAGALFKLLFGRNAGPFLRHRWEHAGWCSTAATGVREIKRCVRCGAEKKVRPQ